MQVQNWLKDPQKRRILQVVAGLVLVFGLIFGWKFFAAWYAAYEMSQMPPPVTTVAAAPVTAEKWRGRIDAIGDLSAVQGADISAEVSGTVTRIAFESGQKVSAGDLLVQLDDAAEQGHLRSLKAQLEAARLDFNRSKDLARTSAASKAKLDRDRAEMESLRGMVEEQEAQLAKRAIAAPFDGVLGIRKVSVGEFVSAGHALVTLQSLEPIHVNFTLPEKYLSRVVAGQDVEVLVAAWPGQVFTGKVTAVSPKVTQTSRNLEVQGTLSNSDGRLRPGMFARVAVLMSSEEQVLTVPETAVTFLPYGDTVYVIGQRDGQAVVTSQLVTTGRHLDGRVEIVDGLRVGQQVVTAGQIKLYSGAAVIIDNSITLPAGVTTP